MVFVKLIRSYRAYKPGELVHVNDSQARHLVRTGMARYHDWDDREEAGHFLDPADPADVVAPARSASKAEWVDYAVSQSVDRGEAETLTKTDLIGLFNSGEGEV